MVLPSNWFLPVPVDKINEVERAVVNEIERAMVMVINMAHEAVPHEPAST